MAFKPPPKPEPSFTWDFTDVPKPPPPVRLLKPRPPQETYLPDTWPPWAATDMPQREGHREDYDT